MSRVVAICTDCGKCKTCGEECPNCKSGLDKFTDYAGALKEAVACWQNAECKEHAIPCKLTLKEFAEKLMEIQQRISVLESAIRSHKELKEVPDEHDKSLWEFI
jgi:hypothetical protein